LLLFDSQVFPVLLLLDRYQSTASWISCSISAFITYRLHKLPVRSSFVSLSSTRSPSRQYLLLASGGVNMSNLCLHSHSVFYYFLILCIWVIVVVPSITFFCLLYWWCVKIYWLKKWLYINTKSPEWRVAPLRNVPDARKDKEICMWLERPFELGSAQIAFWWAFAGPLECVVFFCWLGSFASNKEEANGS
jgi:hypothetical protein